MSRLVTERDTAELLGVSVRTFQKWRLPGNGPRFVKLGHAVRYDLKDLEAYIERPAALHFGFSADTNAMTRMRGCDPRLSRV